MDKRDNLDFETMNVSKMFSKILIPTLLGMVFSASITITDGIFVGHGVGSNGLAAINIVAPLYMITTGIGLMFGIGASIVASIHLSQSKIKAARINITQSIIASFVIMVLISSFTLYFHKEVGYLFGSSDMLLPLVLEYMDWVVPFLAFSMIMNMGLFVIRLDGSPVYAMLCNAIPAVINLILCYLFVIKLGWGVKGSAIACSVGLVIGGIMAITYLIFFSNTLHLYRLKMSKKSFMLSIRNVGYMVRLGSSALLGEVSVASMMIIGNYVFIGALGEDGVAAFSVACYCFPFVFMISNAISQSAQPIISYNYGCGNWGRVNKAIHLSLATSLFFGIVTMLTVVLFCRPLVELFISPSSNAYKIAINGIPYFASGFVLFAINIASIGYYQSIEKSKRATVYTLFRGVFFMIICFLTLPHLLGEKGIWFSVPCSELLTIIVIVSLCIRDNHKNHSHLKLMDT
nr:MATE family efflux transporter [uncultured Bacteroides sp.]